MGEGRSAPVHVGCSGWNYRDWREPVYGGLPQRRWLARYAELFDTVEVNNTFYRLPSQATVAGWVEQTPPGFVFAVKASRYLTHVKRLRGIEAGAGRFFEAIAPLAESPKMGPVLWQLPESFHRDDARLAEEVAALLRRHGAVLVIRDDPARPFQAHELTAGWTYLRFHRGNRGRRGNYSRAELDTWARRIAAWPARHEVFAYFNNDWEAFAPRNAA